MKNRNFFLSMIIVIAITFSCTTPNSKKTVSIIPKPNSIELTKGSFKINSKTNIVLNSKEVSIEKVAKYLASTLEQIIKSRPVIKTGEEGQDILIEIDKSLEKEAYKLDITPSYIKITASKSAGAFYAVQSLIQIINSTNEESNIIVVPCLNINDKPAYKWRGMHLDVARHFFPKEDIKKFIDILAMHKLNVFHWHLTDDQGWRIEIKKYPKLTEVGAWREDREGEIWNIDDEQRLPYDKNKAYYGGFYTQDDIKEIVAYAKERQITIVPEIEMPGHSRAALVAYPEVSCFGYETKVPSSGYVGEKWDFSDPYCAGKEETFEFLQNILDEVMELFPSEYIHIGGDECSKNRWTQCPKCQARIKAEGLKDEFELQSYFIKRIEKYINSKGRKIIGWQEILEGGMEPSAAIMPWKGATALDVCLEAAKGGHKVVMAPSNYLYFNGDWSGEKSVKGWNMNLKHTYDYDPIPQGLDEKYHKSIIGAEACLWSEHVFSFKDVEYQTMPRIAALSEIVWSKKEEKNWEDFNVRLDNIKSIYKKMDINYYISSPKGLAEKTIFTEKASVKFDKSSRGTIIKYTIDGSNPTKNSQEYTSEFALTETTTIKAACFDKYGQSSKVISSLFEKQDFRKGENVDNPQAGIRYKTFMGRFRAVSLVTGEPDKTGVIETIAIVDKNEDKDAGLILEGYIKVPEKAIYTFYLASDDGSTFSIGDKIVVDNDGFHGGKDKEGNLIFKSGQIALDKGYQPFIIKYFDWGNGEMIKLFIENPSLEKKEVGAEMLFHK